VNGLKKAVMLLIRTKPHEVSKAAGKCTIIDSFKRGYLAKRKSLIRGTSQCRTRERIAINRSRIENYITLQA
jgi:hypothetical protein